MAKVLYTAEATVTGGRDEGHGKTSDGQLEVDIRVPEELGGDGGGTNPEQLFAIGYASCFESAIKVVGKRMKQNIDEVSIDSKVQLKTGEERNFVLAVELEVTLPKIDDWEQAAEVVKNAHAVCPYSNATRGNIDVTLRVNEKDLEGGSSDRRDEDEEADPGEDIERPRKDDDEGSGEDEEPDKDEDEDDDDSDEDDDSDDEDDDDDSGDSATTGLGTDPSEKKDDSDDS